MSYQLVPTHCHRINSEERDIRTFKERFVDGLSSLHPDFPMHLWYALMNQAEIKLNFLHTSIFTHCYIPWCITTSLLIITRPHFLRRDAISFHTKILLKGKHGHPMANPDSQRKNYKLDSAFKTPKVGRHSESH